SRLATAAEMAMALMNCGRAPTTVRIFIGSFRSASSGWAPQSSAQDRLNDVILYLLGKIGMHGQAHDPARKLLADGKTLRVPREGAVGRLQVKRERIVDHRRNARGLRSRLQRLPLLFRRCLYRILRPDAHQPFRDDRSFKTARERGRVARRHALALLDLLGIDRKLLKKARRLDRVQPAVEADTDIRIFVLALSVIAERLEQRGHLVAVGEDSTAIPVAAERLGGEEGGGRDVANRPGGAAMIGAAEALRTVADHLQAMLPRDGDQRIIVGRQAEKIDGNHDPRIEAL